MSRRDEARNGFAYARPSLLMIAGTSVLASARVAVADPMSAEQIINALAPLPANNLIVVGDGKSMLKNEDNPLASENRRAQVVNMAAKNVAGQ